MRKSLLTTVLFLIVLAGQSQTKNFIDQPYIEVNGTADTAITPNEIYIKIIISEADTKNKISVEEIIHLHASTTYRVYMLGFLPGFAYMGMVDEKIATPRKQFPAPVEAGSIGIAGRQTGIYPLNSPGGWQIIGRTPLKLFDKEKNDPTLFKTGDTVQFYSITKDEFENSKSGNA